MQSHVPQLIGKHFIAKGSGSNSEPENFVLLYPTYFGQNNK